MDPGLGRIAGNTCLALFDPYGADSNGIYALEAVAEYARCFTPAAIHASCADYRVGAGVDLIHDQADAARPLSCPMLALWSKAGIGRDCDVELLAFPAKTAHESTNRLRLAAWPAHFPARGRSDRRTSRSGRWPIFRCGGADWRRQDGAAKLPNRL